MLIVYFHMSNKTYKIKDVKLDSYSLNHDGNKANMLVYFYKK